MDLFFRHFGKGIPLIILHGLYGSSDNWISAGRLLSEDFEVYLPDQRNHGNSPHSKEHNYTLLKNDLLKFMNQHNIEKAVLIGHSMGGKTAMYFADENPDRIRALIVVDIAPGPYKYYVKTEANASDHLSILNAMSGVDFSKVKSRSDVDKQLSPMIRSIRIRQFLLKNIVRTGEKYSWRLNIKTLYDQLYEIMDGLDVEKYISGKRKINFPTLFIKGEKSNYISNNDFNVIYTIFPGAEIITIPDAGHWLHAEKPELFLKTVQEFLAANSILNYHKDAR